MQADEGWQGTGRVKESREVQIEKQWVSGEWRALRSTEEGTEMERG